MTGMPDPSPKEDNLRKAYEEVCNSYHRIDDFRAKLLGFLPLVSGTGLFLLLRDKLPNAATETANPHLPAIGIFGATVTIALFFYELRGVQRCTRLADIGKELEMSMGVRGQFVQWAPSFGRFINEPIAASIIYPAVIAGWLYVALVTQSLVLAICVSTFVFATGFICGWQFYRYVRGLRRKIEKKQNK